jgi:2-polyprenyl-6-methoxyphenol hydroxylase-like FAD-dependent oxidoreductase
MRPVLHTILSTRVREAGVNVQLGVTVQHFVQNERRVRVELSDGSHHDYDLMLGADGVRSRIRTLLFPDAPTPTYTGQGVWRVVVPRPAAIDRRHFFLGGPVKVGLTPVSRAEMYMFLLETRKERAWVSDDRAHLELARLLHGYGGHLERIRVRLEQWMPVVYRPLEAFFLPAPWYRGRVLLLGDAAHPTSPQLASGAGMAIEDGLVLAEEMGRVTSVEAAYEAFMQRRFDRCQLVVRNSLEIGRREQRGDPIESQTILVEESLRSLAEPI